MCIQNSNIKRWLHQMSSYTGPVDVEAILGMSVQSAIAELRDDPIGLGSDYFLINETFIVGVRKLNSVYGNENYSFNVHVILYKSIFL